jgi:hypothetical protein
MHARLHLHHRIEVNDGSESSEPPSLQHSTSNFSQANRLNDDAVTNKIQILVEALASLKLLPKLLLLKHGFRRTHLLEHIKPLLTPRCQP